MSYPEAALGSEQELLAAFEPYAVAIAGVRMARRLRPASQIEGYLDSGSTSDAFYLPHHQIVVKLPFEDNLESPDVTVHTYINDLSPGRGQRGFEQIVAASYDTPAVATRLVSGRSLSRLSTAEIDTMSEPRLHALCDSFDFMEEHVLYEENPDKDLFFDQTAADARDAFTMVDFRDSIGTVPAAHALIHFAMLMSVPDSRLLSAQTRAQYAELVADQVARLDLLDRLAEVTATRYPDSYQLEEALALCIDNAEARRLQYREQSWFTSS